MNPTRALTPAAVLVALTIAVTPALAQRQQREDSGRQSSNRAVGQDLRTSRSAPGGEAARPGPRSEQVAPRSVQIGPRAVPRDGQSEFRRDSRVPQYDPRYAPRYDTRDWRYDRDDRFDRRYSYERRGPVFAAPFHSFVFRPRLRLGIGLWLGYPIPYPYSYPYSYPYVSGRYPAVAPGIAYGGISLAINPGYAAVHVDGAYVGLVEDFCDTTHPLTLSAGTHRIEAQAPGYRPMVFDVNIVPGQLIPYQGDMPPY